MNFMEETWPLLVVEMSKAMNEDALNELRSGFERYFARGERYSLLSVTPRGAATPSAKERKAIADWTNSPRVRQFSKELCVGSAAVVTNPLARGAITAMLWLWTPASPFKVVASIEEGLDYCFSQSAKAGLKLPRELAVIRKEILARLQGMI